jgi:hypothetical protein
MFFFVSPDESEEAYMLALLFRFEPAQEDSSIEDARFKFNTVVYSWSRLRQNDKLQDIFGEGGEVSLSSPIVSQVSLSFELRISLPDELQTLNRVSCEDLPVALGLSPSEWTVWQRLC